MSGHAESRTATHRGIRAISLLVVLTVVAAGCAWTARVNLAATGAQAVGGDSIAPAMSADGRYIAYASVATNLVPGDTNGVSDIFRRDVVTGTTTRISVDGLGGQALGGDSTAPAMSADGRYITYSSSATNLVAGDANGISDIFLHDTVSGSTTRLSVDTAGQGADGASTDPAISADGLRVAFVSTASDLVAGDSNARPDIFVRNLTDGSTARVNVDDAGSAAAGGDSFDVAISADGRYVAFVSAATNLVAGDVNGVDDIFLRDTVGGTTTRVSIDSSGSQATGGNSRQPGMSPDGRFVVFTSAATDLVTTDTNGNDDIFVRDTLLATTIRMSVDEIGNEVFGGGSAQPDISADGSLVVFSSAASDIVAGDTNGNDDIFLRDTVAATTTRLSVDQYDGEAIGGWSREPDVSADGRYVAYASAAVNLVPGDTNGVVDIVSRRTERPALTGVSPNLGDRGTPVTLTVTGEYFTDVTMAGLGGGIGITSLVVVSDTEIEIEIDIAADAPLGPRTLVLGEIGTLGPLTGAVGECPDCFTVSDPWSIADPSPDIQAIHASLLPTGKVLIIEGNGWDQTQHASGTYRAGLWDPTDNSFTEIITPVDLFCVGHAQLADGRLLISGGTATWAGGALEGAPDAFLFNPWTEQFEPVDAGVVGRWYPTVVNLDDGTTLTIGGIDGNGVSTNTYEIWDPATGTFGPVGTFPGSQVAVPLYPALHLLERDAADSTRLFYSGVYAVGTSPDAVPGIWDLDNNTYTPVPGLRQPEWTDQAASILLPPAQDQTVMVIGGGNLGQIATDRVDLVDLRDPSPAFVPGPSISESKMFVLASILPDRTVIQAGGVDRHISGFNAEFHANAQARFSVQTYDPTTNQWTDRPQPTVARAYHSEMVLLDDGRVALLGGQWAPGPGERRVEILEPWYFNEARPTIDSAPAAISFGQSFDITVTVATGKPIAYVELVKPSTATHSLDPGHRLVDLDFSVSGNVITATPNFGGDLAPAGYYMLNVVDADGVPSVSTWVQLG
jgi:Tol biopolymer transport system component